MPRRNEPGPRRNPSFRPGFNLFRAGKDHVRAPGDDEAAARAAFDAGRGMVVPAAPFMAKTIKELTAQEVLALAIQSEEEDGRIYADLARRIGGDFPATGQTLEAMRAEEDGHRHRLIELYRDRFGEHIPLIRRQDVKGFHHPQAFVDPCRADGGGRAPGSGRHGAGSPQFLPASHRPDQRRRGASVARGPGRRREQALRPGRVDGSAAEDFRREGAGGRERAAAFRAASGPAGIGGVDGRQRFDPRPGVRGGVCLAQQLDGVPRGHGGLDWCRDQHGLSPRRSRTTACSVDAGTRGHAGWFAAR